MMKNCVAVFTIIFFVLFHISCKQNSNKKESKEATVDTTHFFPVNDYISQQIKSIDTTNYYLYRLITKAHKQDSISISKAMFDSIAKEFIAYNIADSAMKKFYKENVFQDESTDSYTISYSCINDSLPLQNIEVLLSRQDEQVKRIFMSVQQHSQDSTVIKKMGWKANANFYINTMISYTNGKSSEEQNMIIWKDKK